MTDYLKATDLSEVLSVNDQDIVEIQKYNGVGDYESMKITAFNFFSSSRVGTVGVSVDGGTLPVTTGVKGYVVVPYNAIVFGWHLLGTPLGSVIFDVWKASGKIPTIADTITGDQKPNIVSGELTSNMVVDHWTTQINAGDVVAFNVDSASEVIKTTLTLLVKKL